MYLQCKLTLQVQSKHIKILKKQKQSLNQLAYMKRKKKTKNKKCTSLLNKPKKHYSWTVGSFYIVNRYDRLHKYLKKKKTQTDNWKKKNKTKQNKTLGTV